MPTFHTPRRKSAASFPGAAAKNLPKRLVIKMITDFIPPLAPFAGPPSGARLTFAIVIGSRHLEVLLFHYLSGSVLVGLPVGVLGACSGKLNILNRAAA